MCPGQTTAITFIFRTDAHPISTMFIPFFSTPPELKLSKCCLSFTPDAALEITPRRAGSHSTFAGEPHFIFPSPRLRSEGGVDAAQSAASAVCAARTRKKMRNPDLDLSLRLSAAELFSCSALTGSASADGAPPPQSVFPHSGLSSAHQPRPPTVNLPPTTQGSGTSHFPSIVLSSCRPLWKSTSSLLFINAQSLHT